MCIFVFFTFNFDLYDYELNTCNSKNSNLHFINTNVLIEYFSEYNKFEP